jgi:heme-degrading monooxygenase HmoA
MEFDPSKVEDFLNLFDNVKEKIEQQSGCNHVELCRDARLDHVYYTFSIWQTEADLENYRASKLFEETWARTKILFGGKPSAFSLIK